ncbi:MAG: hypothetical protein V1918_07820, partial [Planctomycetota bacterium]
MAARPPAPAEWLGRVDPEDGKEAPPFQAGEVRHEPVDRAGAGRVAFALQEMAVEEPPPAVDVVEPGLVRRSGAYVQVAASQARLPFRGE